MTGATTEARERFLVTGACGCIGAWVIRQLLDEGTPVVALDVSDDRHRLELLLSDDELAGLAHAMVDITDLNALERTLDEYEITNVIHLAALQVPFCRADPPRGARVNVVGTVNVLEAVARRRDRLAPLVYASSVAAYESVDDERSRPPSADAGIPGTLYGVYKRANEATAAALLARPQPCQRRPAPAHGVWARPRPGPDLGAHSRDARSRRGRSVPSSVRRPLPVPVRPGRGEVVHHCVADTIRRRLGSQPRRTIRPSGGGRRDD